MKTNSIIALILSISLFGLFGCADKYEVDYEAPVKIEFAGVDQNNRVSLTKGIAEYTATVKVQGEIMSFEIYQADSKTGMQGSLIEELRNNLQVYFFKRECLYYSSRFRYRRPYVPT